MIEQILQMLEKKVSSEHLYVICLFIEKSQWGPER